MSDFRYCKQCTIGLKDSTPYEDLLYGGQLCPECGYRLPPRMNKAEWICALYEEIAAIKARQELLVTLTLQR